MAKKKYLDQNGILYVWTKIKALLGGKVDKVEGKGLSTNDLTDELKEKILNAGTGSFDGQYSSLYGKPAINGTELKSGNNTLEELGITIPTKISELTNDNNYQTETEVTEAINKATEGMATQDYVNQQVANINQKTIVTDITQMTDSNIIYLIANEGAGNNIYDEYIVVDGTPEKIGTTEIDLTNYVKHSELVEITNEEIDAIFAS